MAALQVLTLGMPLAARAQQTVPTEFSYDAEGNVKTIKDPIGSVTDHEVDNLSRLKKKTLPAPSPAASRPVVNYGYDGQDRISSVQDPRGNTTTYNYSGLGDVDQVSPDTGASTTWVDEMGQLYWQKNAKLAEKSYFYDTLNRLTKVEDSLGYTSLGYDAFSTTSGSENYGKGRLTSVAEVDKPGNVQSSRVNLSYDRLGRVTKRCQIWGTATACATTSTDNDTLAYNWGPKTGADAGRLLGLTYPSGRKVEYTYNALGQVTQVTTTDPGSTTAQVVARSITYTPLDVASGGYGLTSLSFGPSSSTQVYQRSYDTSGRLLTFTLGMGLTSSTTNGLHVIDYDDTGIILGINRFNNSWTSNTFDYDYLNRLIGMSFNGGSLFAYDYDANGNRTLKTASGTSTTHTYPTTSNRLSTTKVGSAASQNVTTDAVGNITQDPAAPAGSVNFIYSDRTGLPYGRLATTQSPGGQYAYQHNYFGQRISKTGSNYTASGGTVYTPVAYIGSTATQFHYDLSGHLIAEQDTATKQVKREYIWLGDMPLAVIAGSTPTAMITASGGVNAPAVYYIHTDQINTPRLVTDAAKVKRWDWTPMTSEPFGATAPGEAPASQAAAQNFTLNMRFPGQYLDKETGVLYNYYRIYNPATGRYLQSDSIGLLGGVNTYIYVNGNPLGAADPLGLFSLENTGPIYLPQKPRPGSPSPCATAECAAGLLPAPSENRSADEIAKSINKKIGDTAEGKTCSFVCNAVGNICPVPGAVTKPLCSIVCK